MTMYSDIYYIINENNDGTFSCIQSHKNIERAKQHAKTISEQLSITSLIVKPIAKVKINTKWVIEDLQEDNK